MNKVFAANRVEISRHTKNNVEPLLPLELALTYCQSNAGWTFNNYVYRLYTMKVLCICQWEESAAPAVPWVPPWILS